MELFGFRSDGFHIWEFSVQIFDSQPQQLIQRCLKIAKERNMAVGLADGCTGGE
jgi:hypothetical protein